VEVGERLLEIYRQLLDAYGPQGWWPGETPFEVMVGAILAQNTSWRNVERALERLKTEGLLSPGALYTLPVEELTERLRPAGTYRVKAVRLRAFLDYLFRVHAGDPQRLAIGDLKTLRNELLAVPGIGPETADSILLYGAGQPTFVVDGYTARLLARLGLAQEKASYQALRALFMAHLPPDAAMFNEYHALIVRHGKERCRKRVPRCEGCPLLGGCAFAAAPCPGDPLAMRAGQRFCRASGDLSADGAQ
jgi:endonuclease-3 related protein